MRRLEALREKVRTLYESQSPNRDEWSDWLYPNHVLIVAKYARDLAARKGANSELAEAAALLHDLADSTMPRENSDHEDLSLRMGRDMMHECGYDNAEIELVIDDAIKHHSCRGDDRPRSIEGLVLAAADSMSHFKLIFMFMRHGHTAVIGR